MHYAQIKTQYTDEQVARQYDRVRFSSPIGRLFDILEQRALSAALTWVRRQIPQPSVLDVPCGTGRITRLWLQHGLVVTAGDVSPAMLRVAQEKCAQFGNRVRFQLMDLDQPLPDERAYDVVSCIRLLHHLDAADRATVLRHLARAARYYVIVNLPLSTRYYRWRRRLKRILKQGVSRCSATWSEIRNESHQAGLRIVRARMMLPLLSENLILVLTHQS
jgi:2-polyprenyl-3-methyl-5-hydroxy-6-metoxy-1,4-benzoquinol methylase